MNTTNPLQIFTAEIKAEDKRLTSIMQDPDKVRKLQRMVVEAVTANPKLLSCDRNSLMRAVVDAATLDLVPDGIRGMGYLVPYKNEVQFLAGYQGLLHLMRQSDEVADVSLVEAYENDVLTIVQGSKPSIDHKIALTDRGEMIGAYAIVHWRDTAMPVKFEWMPVKEIEDIRDRYSQSYRYEEGPKGHKDSAWHKAFGMQSRKTVARRLAKTMPYGSKAQAAAAMEESLDSGVVSHLGDDGVIETTGEVIGDETKPKNPGPQTSKRLERLKKNGNAQTASQQPSEPAQAELSDAYEKPKPRNPTEIVAALRRSFKALDKKADAERWLLDHEVQLDDVERADKGVFAEMIGEYNAHVETLK